MPRRRRRKRHLDRPASFARYRARLAEMEDAAFAPLAGTWLSTFDVYSSIAANEDGEVCPGTGMDENTAFLLADEARRRGHGVAGVTSARKSGGSFICDRMPDGTPRSEVRCTYVGAYNYFTSHPETIWCLSKADRVYHPLSPLRRPIS